jgi:hypothetical protein
MKGKLIWSIFWALLGVFVFAVCVMAIMAFRELVEGFIFMAIAGAAFVVLGGLLIFLTVRQKVAGLLKKFLLTTGASAIGIPVGIVLHNVVYGLFIYFFGADFWSGGDEPFFFIMGLIVCPIGFLVGVVGSIVLAVKEHRQVSST